MTAKHHVLISPLGQSPGAVSGVYFGLQKKGIQVDEVITVGTSDEDVQLAVKGCLNQLFEAEPGLSYRPRFMASEELRGNDEDISPFAARMGLYIQQARQSGAIVHMAVTGGRSGMGALAALAGQLYGAHHLWHLWVDSKIEKGGTSKQFRSCTRENKYLNPTQAGDGEDDRWELVELPLVDLTWLHEPIQEYIQTGAVSDVNALPKELQGDETANEKSRVRLKYLVALRKFLMAHFNLEEFRTLCFDLGIDYDVLVGEGKGGKVRELVSYLDRRERVRELADEVQERRSDVMWPDDLRTAPPQEVPLLYTFVQASRSALASIFPAGLTTAAADQIVTLTPTIRRGSDVEAEQAWATLVDTLQNAGIFDLDTAEALRNYVSLPATRIRMRRLIDTAREEDDQEFFRWLSDRLPEASELSSQTEMTIARYFLEVFSDWLRDDG